MMTGVSTITKKGFTACQISGAILLVFTKSRANMESDCPFWWKENQKNTTTPRTAKRAYMRCLISLAMACFSSAVYSTETTASFLPGLGKRCLVRMKMSREMSMAATEAMKE